MKKIFLLASVLFFSCNNDKEIKPIKQDIKDSLNLEMFFWRKEIFFERKT